MDTDQQPKELTRLIETLVGKWAVTLQGKTADGAAFNGNGTLQAFEIVSGFGIRTEMEIDIEGLGNYLEQDLWSYQRWEKKLHIYSITSTGAVHDHVGEWKDENTLSFYWAGLNEGKPSTEDLTIQLVSSEEIRGHEVDSVEGRVETELEYIFRKA